MIFNVGDAAQCDILASAGLEKTLLPLSTLRSSDLSGSGEGSCRARMNVRFR